MLSKLIKSNSFVILLFFFLYFSLIFGFYINENLNFGSYNDWIGTNYPPIKGFASDFKKSFLNYEDFKHRHSPVYLIFLSFFYKLGFSGDLVRLLHLHLSLFLIYYFYKCLRLKFNKINNNYLLVLSFVIFLSPTFRSIAIWPDTRVIGLIFFTTAVYHFLKFQKNQILIHFWLSIILLIICSYISPNFSLFIIFFYFYFLRSVKLFTLISSSIFCLICSLPAFYYLFVLDVNFLIANTPAGGAGASALDFNLSNKIMIISSIILFHLIPFIFNKDFFEKIKEFVKKYAFFLILFFFLNLYFFDYTLSFTGGGFFFQVSNIFFNNNILFFIFSFLSIVIIFYTGKIDKNNILLFFLLIISNIQNTIYHKYYDPLILIMFFTILNLNLISDFFKKKYSLDILYLFYLSYIFLRLTKNIYLS